jgi:hypothetical protein
MGNGVACGNISPVSVSKTPRVENNIFTVTCAEAEEEKNMPKNCNAAISATILMLAKACCAVILNFKKIQFGRRFYDTLG